MGNHLPKQTYTLQEIFEDNGLYSYNVNEDVFHVQIKFFTTGHIKRIIEYYCRLSCVV